MGLDITVYPSVKKAEGDLVLLDGETPSDAAYRLGILIPYINPAFPDQAKGLEEVPYEVEGEEWGFRAGSYSGYSRWRNQLAALVGITSLSTWWASSDLTGPFAELLNFSDCAGVIGPVTSAKLAKDFAEWESRAKKFSAAGFPADSYFLESYREWKKAFEAAAGEGCVVFH